MASNLLEADKCSTLEVGKYYLVAHATVKWGNVTVDVPVIPILHDDKVFAPDIPKHYHLDNRFNRVGNAVFLWGENGELNNKIVNDVDAGLKEITLVEGIKYLRKKCVRNSTGLNAPTNIFSTSITKVGIDFIRWKQSMVGKSCAGKKCPHYGALMMEQGDKLVCPMHGLVGDKVTEKIIACDN